MRLGPLRLFSRTSSARTFNVASWHSPHSLTWSWILSLRRQPIVFPRPFALITREGGAVGLGQLLAFRLHRDNNGWQWAISALWHSFDWSSQRPMWFHSMCRRAWDECEELKREASKLRRELEAVKFGAVRAANPVAGANLN